MKCQIPELGAAGCSPHKSLSHSTVHGTEAVLSIQLNTKLSWDLPLPSLDSGDAVTLMLSYLSPGKSIQLKMTSRNVDVHLAVL